MGGTEDQAGSPDAFSRMAARPQLVLARALADAQLILSGPAIQARCLECPVTPAPLRGSEKASLASWLQGLLKL